MEKKTNIFIQARISSTRLSNKMLLKINNLEIIEWVILRLKKSKFANKIVLCTSNKNVDLKLVKVAKNNNIDFITGPENDVLKRFEIAHKKFPSKNIVRVCADNPFIDHIEVDRLIKNFNSNKYDYSFNNQPKLNTRCADGFGAEIFSDEVLNKMNRLVIKNAHKEHATQYIWDNLNKFKIKEIKIPKFLEKPNIRMDIDNRKDYLKILKIVDKFDININSSAKVILKRMAKFI